MDPIFLSEHRCECGKLLLKGIFFDGILEIKCKKCGKKNKIGSIKLENDTEHYFLVINHLGQITNMSDSVSRILGYSYNDLIGKNFSKVNPTIPKELGKKFFGVNSILSEDNYFQLDTFHQNSRNEKIPVNILLKLYKSGEKERYVLLLARLRNKTSRKNASDKDEISFLNSSTCNFYFDLDKNGVIEYMSAAVKDFFKFLPEAVVGSNYFKCVPIGERKASKLAFDYFSRKEEPYRTKDTACLSTNGKTVHSELFFTPNYDNMGKFVGYRVLVWAAHAL